MLEMTASSISYSGDGDQINFPIPFPFLSASHIVAAVKDQAGSERLLQAGIDFTVSQTAGATGELILQNGALSAGQTLIIRRVVPLTQEILFHNQGPNAPQAIENGLDKLTMIAQQQTEKLDRSILLPETVANREEFTAELVEAVQAVESLRSTVAAVSDRVAAKADANHRHLPAEVAGLDDVLDGKAEQTAVDAALLAKAAAVHSHALGDVQQLTGRLSGLADKNHSHATGEIDGLEHALAAKMDKDDLDSSFPPLVHATQHGRNGADPLTPAAIGAVTPPPDDGKTYLAIANGWVEYVASTGGPGEGTMDHSQLLNRDAPDQHPQSAVQHLVSDLESIRSGINETDALFREIKTVVDGKADRSELPGEANGQSAGLLSAADKVKLDGLPEAWDEFATLELMESGLSSIEARLQSLEGSAIGDAPKDGRQYVRQNGEWREASGGSGGSGESAALMGEIRLLPFRAGDLPAGWYFCNGDRFALGTAGADALLSLPETMRTDWGIVADAAGVNLPDLFSGERGCFIRAVNNSSRMPGNIQTDAIRNITGSVIPQLMTGMVSSIPMAEGVTTGAFTLGEEERNFCMMFNQNVGRDLLFDASRTVPTAEENRPLNIGMTPAIYLGV